jgi:hypothetical protein
MNLILPARRNCTSIRLSVSTAALMSRLPGVSNFCPGGFTGKMEADGYLLDSLSPKMLRTLGQEPGGNHDLLGSGE